MQYGPTVSLVSGRLVACYRYTCEIYQEGSWQHLQNITTLRQRHSSATTEDAVLLIGDDDVFSEVTTAEWIPLDETDAQQGPFTVRHGYEHCSIQISANAVVVTGGYDTKDYVTQYNLTDGNETPLTPLGQPRYIHACGVYQDAGGQQVSKSLCS